MQKLFTLRTLSRYKFFYISAVLTLLSFSSYAVVFTYKVGATSTYQSIAAAYAQITNTGDTYYIELQTDYNVTSEPVFPISLTAKTTNFITIYPASNNPSFTITYTGGNSLFDLNGTKNVIIDGRPGATGAAVNLMTIDNTTTTSGSFTMVFENGATTNTVQYCIIKGSNSSTTSSTAGVICFKGVTSTNKIDNCNITKSTAIPPIAINTCYNGLGNGLSTGNTVSNCNIYDFTTNGIKVATGCSSLSFINNSLYQTATITPTADVEMISIASGNGYTITGNYLGGQAPLCAGTNPFTLSVGSYALRAINFVSSTAGTTNTILKNTIRNIGFSGNNYGSVYAFNGISMNGAGSFTCGSLGSGNTIGNTTSSITFSNSATGGNAGLTAISNSSTGTVSIANNKIAGITITTGSSTHVSSLISNTGTSATIDSNTIGSINAASVAVTGSAGLSLISNTSTSLATITNNYFQNISYGVTSNATFYGINSTGSGAIAFSGNTFNNITSTANTLTSLVYYTGSTASTLKNNIFQNITVNGANTTTALNVFDISSSAAITIDNNIIGSTSANNIFIDGNKQSNIINNNGSGAFNVTNNTIRNIKFNNSGTSQTYTLIGYSIASNAGQFVCTGNNINTITSLTTSTTSSNGIYSAGANTNNNISTNTISSIAFTSTASVASSNIAINVSGGNGTVSRNMISKNSTTTTAASELIGISISSGTWTLQNNIILLDNNGGTNAVNIYGISSKNSGNVNVYYNTISVGGTSGSLSSCIALNTPSAACVIKDNIFKNTRTSSTSVAELYVSGTNVTTNYNYIEAKDGARTNNTSYTYATWAAASGATNTVSSVTPIVLDATGLVTSYQYVVAGKGTPISGLTTDFVPITRNTTTPWIGAYEGMTINTTSPSSAVNYCPGSSFNVAFTTTNGTAGSYNIELSDGTGSFASPVVLGTGNVSPITANLPAKFNVAGSAYRVRAVSAVSPIIYGSANSAAITIYQNTYTITNVADNNTNSLYWAIGQANGNTSCSSSLYINFTLGAGPTTIALTTALPTLTASNTIIDGLDNNTAGTANTIPVFNANTTALNPTYRVIIKNSATNGLVVSGNNNTIRGLVFYDFGSATDGIALTLTGNTNKVYGNYIGVTSDGKTKGVNTATGILVKGQNNLIGDGTAANANLISGFNSGGNFALNIQGATGTIVKGNIIGLAKDGTFITGSAQNSGIWLNTSASSNQIGGSNAGDGNVISGNATSGINLGAAGNSIIGNRIGTNAAGTAIVTSSTQTYGIYINGVAGNNIINGNTISGNATYGIYTSNTSGTLTTSIINNIIGLNVTGNALVTGSVQKYGISIIGSTLNTIGGSSSTSNVISGNTTAGIFLSGAAGNNTITANTIGSNMSGVSVGGQQYGVYNTSTGTNTVGAAGAPNLITNNTTGGVYVTGSASSLTINSIACNSANTASGIVRGDNTIPQPVLTGSYGSPTTLQITNLPSAGSKTIYIYKNTTCGKNQGETYITSISVTSGSNSGTYSGTAFNIGDNITVMYDIPSTGSSAFSAALTLAPPANTWIGGGNTSKTDWNDPTNWSLGTVPSATDNVVIPQTSYNPVLSSNVTVKSITIQSSGYLTLPSKYTLNVSNGITNNGTICKGGTINGTVSNVGPAFVQAAPTSSVISAKPICNGDTPLIALSSNPATGVTMNWTATYNLTNGVQSAGYSGSATNDTITDYIIGSGSGKAFYTIIPDYNGCAGDADTASIIINSPQLIVTDNNNGNVCSGNATNIDLSSIPTGATFSWVAMDGSTLRVAQNHNARIMNGGASGYSDGTGNKIAQVLTGSGPVQYQITAKLNGCSSDVTFENQSVNPVPNVSAAFDGANSICSGGSTTIDLSTDDSDPKFGWTRAAVSGISPATGSGHTTSNNFSETLTNSTASPITVTYIITDTSSSNCVGQTSIDLIVNPASTITLTSGSSNTNGCNGVPITNIRYTVTGASGATVSNLPSGISGTYSSGIFTISGTSTNTGSSSYYITTTSSCSANASGFIYINSGPSISLSSAAGTDTQTKCINTAISNITYSVSGVTSASASNLPAGVTATFSEPTSLTISGTPSASGPSTYTITTTGNTCPPPNVTGTITVTPTATITLSSAANSNIQNVCTGSPLSTITYNISNAAGASVSGLPTGITGTFASGVVTISGNSSTPGTYNYTVTTSGGCAPATTSSGTITIITKPTVNPVAPTAICSGASTNITLVSSPAGATFSWGTPSYSPVGAITGGTSATNVSGPINNVLTNSTASNATAVYVVTANIGGCIGVGTSISQTVNPAPNVTANPASPAICSGTATSIALTSVPSGATFSWPVPTMTGVTGGTASSGTSIAQNLSGNGTAKYIVTPVLNSCSGIPLNVIVTVNPIPAAPAVSNPPAYCQNSTVPALTATVLTGNVLQWYRVPTGGIASATKTPSTATVGDSAYYVSQKSSSTSCEGPRSTITITTKSLPATPFTSSTNPLNICSGLAASFAVNDNSGTTITWSAPSLSGVTSSAGGGTAVTTANISSTFTGQGTATYAFVPNLNGCDGAAFSFVVRVNALPVVNITSAANPKVCIGGTAAFTSNISGGTWYNSTSPTNATINSGGVATGLAAGTSTIYYTYTDANSCSNTATQTLTINAAPVINTIAAPAAICSGTATNISFSSTSASDTYNWSVASVTPASSVGGAAAGTGSPIAQTLTNTTTAAGVVKYSITAKDINGCVSTAATVSQTVNPRPTVNPVTTTAICSGNSANIALTSPAGGATFNWVRASTTGITPTNGSGNTSPITETLTNTNTSSTNVTYSVTASSNGCTGAIQTITQAIEPVPTVIAGNNTQFCKNGISFAINATTTNVVSGKWSSSDPLGTFADATQKSTTYTPTANEKTIGTTTLIFKSNPSGACTTAVSGSYTITYTNAPSISAGSDGNVCMNAFPIHLNGSGTNVTWSTVTDGQFDNQTITNPVYTPGAADISAGSVTLTITTPAANGCAQASANVTYTFLPLPAPPTSPDVSYCKGATASQLNAYGDNGNTLKWYNVSTGGSNLSVTPTPNTTKGDTTYYYYVSQVTSSGCESSRTTVTITINGLPGLTTTGATACKQTTAQITLNPSGNEPFSYQWIAQVNDSITNTQNSNGFENVTSITQTLDLIGNKPKTQLYNITIIDANGCKNTATDSIVVRPCSFNTHFTLDKNTVCFVGGKANVKITPRSVGGVAWTWDFGPTTDYTTTLATLSSNASNGTAMNDTTNAFVVSFTKAGTKTIALTLTGPNSNTLTKKLTFTIGVIPAITVHDTTICSGSVAGTVISSTTPGTTFAWTPVSGSPVKGASIGNGATITNVLTDSTSSAATLTYQITATDSSLAACTNTATSTVTVNPILAAPTAIPDTIFCNQRATLTAIGTNSTWYDAKTGGNVLANGSSYQTNQLTGDTVFYVAASSSCGVSARTAVPVTIKKINQTITFAAIPSQLVGKTIQLNATASSLLSITYASSDENIVTITNTSATAIKGGIVTITATQAGSSCYNPATATQQMVIIDNTKHKIVITPISSITFGDLPASIKTNVDAQTQSVITYSSSDTNIAVIRNNALIALRPGNVNIIATNNGNNNYEVQSSAITVKVIMPDFNIIAIGGSHEVERNSRENYKISPVSPICKLDFSWTYTDKDPATISIRTADSSQFGLVFISTSARTGTISCRIRNPYVTSYDSTCVFAITIPSDVNKNQLAAVPCDTVISTSNSCKGIYISEVYLSNIVNKEATCSPGGYEDNTKTPYTSNMYLGDDYNAEIHIGNNQPSFTSPNYVGIWIDYNNDGDFEDPNEFLMSSYSKDAVVKLNNLVISANSELAGVHRLRIKAQSSPINQDQSCVNSNTETGETEDYKVTLEIPNSLEAPVLVSPNDDGKNDLFIIKGINVKNDNKLIILDKIGTVQYSINNYANTWGGMSHDGTLLPPDTYYYVFTNGDNIIRGYFEIRY